MENQDFRISKKTIWFLIFGNLLLTFLGAVAKIQHWQFSEILLTLAMLLFFTVWVIVLSDIAKNKIYNKTFWLFSVIIFPFIALFIYLFRRDNLLNKN